LRSRTIPSSRAPNRSSPGLVFARAITIGPPGRSPAAGSCAPTSRDSSCSRPTC
jgi:hypothetical protein